MSRKVWSALFGTQPQEPRPSYTPRREDLRRSPVPWVSDEVWTCWSTNRSDQDLAPVVVQEPELIDVTEGDRTRCPRIDAPPGAPLPPAGSHPDHLALLASTPSEGGWIYCPAWPICCSRLTTLLFEQGCGVDILDLEAAAGSLHSAFLEQIYFPDHDQSDPQACKEVEGSVAQDLDHLRRWGAADGVLIFHCRVCGGIYLSACHP